MSPEPTRHADTIIFPASLDPDAVTVVRRLNEHGLETYLVGGCVRDLLLGLIPKDFDVSTAARPRQIRRLFRNSRIIGRRFKLAHIQFGARIVEVATFRAMPVGAGEGPRESDLLITQDNEFGSAEEDVLRRDFTINALLYDVRSGEVIDYVGGVKDLEDRVLRTIGDPAVRFAEDPVRMLRAVKFASRLGLTLAPDVDAALRSSAELIQRSAPPRVLEEIHKLLTCGQARRALPLLLDTGLLAALIPDLAAHWQGRRDELARWGEALDAVDGGQRRLPNALLLAALFLPLHEARAAARPEANVIELLHELVDGLARTMNIPRRDMAVMRQSILLQPRLDGRQRSRARVADVLNRASTIPAVQLMHIAARAGAIDPEIHATWVARIAQLAPDAWTAAAAARERRAGGGRRRSRRGGRRRRRGGRGHSGQGPDTEHDLERDGENEGERDPVRPDRPDEASTDAAADGAGRGRRRRRRGRRGRRARDDRSETREGGARPARSEAPDTAGEADAGSRTDEPAASEAPGRAGGRRRGRRGGRRRRSRGAEPAAPREPTDEAHESRAAPAPAARKDRQESPRQESGRRERPPRGRRPDSEPSPKEPRRAFEDVEDIFDW